MQVLPNVVYRWDLLLARVFAAHHFAVDRFSALRGASLIKEKLRDGLLLIVLWLLRTSRIMNAPQVTPTSFDESAAANVTANAKLSHDEIEHRNTVSTVKMLDATDIERVEQMIKLAREQIKRLVLVNEKDIATIVREVEQLGGQDTAGMLVRLARLDLTHVEDGEEHLTQDEFSEFMKETKQLLDGMKSSVLNQSVISALLLTVAGPSLLGPFDNMFPTAWHDDQATPTAALFRINSGSIARTAWGDAGAYFRPDDEEAAAQIRRSFFVCEMITLSLSFAFAALGLFIGRGVYHALVAMPGTIATLSFVIDMRGRGFAITAWANHLAILSLVTGYVFAAARTSFVSFICLASSLMMVGLYPLCGRLMGFSPTVAATRAMHSEAKRALCKFARFEEQRKHARAAQMVKFIGTGAVNLGTGALNLGANALSSGALKFGTGAVNVGASAVGIGTGALNLGANALSSGALKFGTGAVNVGASAVHIGTGAVNLGAFVTRGISERAATPGRPSRVAPELETNLDASGTAQGTSSREWPQGTKGSEDSSPELLDAALGSRSGASRPAESALPAS